MFTPLVTGRRSRACIALSLFLSACKGTEPLPSAAPTLAAPLSSVSVLVGQPGTFTVDAEGSGPFSYQWRKGDSVIVGATGESYTTPAATIADSGSVYTVEVTNRVGSVSSGPAKLFVYREGNLLATLVNFGETAARNWNFGGHSVDARFNEDYGKWDYDNATYEPWLFDRPEVFRMLSEMTGDPRWLAQANSDLIYYESRMSPTGVFLNKGDDTKYSYVHTWSTDTAKRRAAFEYTRDGFPNVANLAAGQMWTERELWVALDAATKYFTVTGDSAGLRRAQAMVDQWDAVTAGRGAPLVSYTQHEGGGPGGSSPTDLITSPWMAALYFQAARLYIARNPAAATQVYTQASNYFDWLNVPANRGFYPGTDAHPEYAGLVFPAYLAGGTTIGDAGPDEGNMDHALDVAGFIAFAIRAKQALGLPTTAAQSRLTDMKITAARAFGNWTRSTTYLPKYRLTPPRKFNWWVRGMFELRANGGG
jgi:hypothetical protein